MDREAHAELKRIYRMEKRPHARCRMIAANMVCLQGMSVRDTARMVMETPAWVEKWARRYEEKGPRALRDRGTGGLDMSDHELRKSIDMAIKLGKAGTDWKNA